jgi:hypothetical protein
MNHPAYLGHRNLEVPGLHVAVLDISHYRTADIIGADCCPPSGSNVALSERVRVSRAIRQFDSEPIQHSCEAHRLEQAPAC